MTQLERFQTALKENGAKCALISSELNIRYLCGFNYTDGYLLISTDRAYLITDFRYIEAAKAAVTNFEIIMPRGNMLNEIYGLLKANELTTLLVEEDELSLAAHKRLSGVFEGVELVAGASVILKNNREIKLAYELDIIDRAQRITDAAFDHILGYITPERTELDVALELEFFMKKMGAEGLAFETIAVSGKASSLPHGVPSAEKLSKGFLTMDFGAKYEGYCSDMTRTVVLGRADDEMKKVYNTVLTAQKAALDALHEGIVCREADKIARDIITEAGYGENFGHSLGHGVGMFIHESPRLASGAPESSVLCRGNVVTVEPGIYLEGKYGCRIEDMVAIDLDGSVRNFTKSPKELIEL